MLPPNGTGAAQIRTIVGVALEMTDRDTWPEPDLRLINDDRPPAPELEDDALHAGWEAWISAEAEARACPRDYVAAALICAVSGWVNNARCIMPTPDWIEAVHLWFALIGAPSTGKTPALGPIKAAERLHALELGADDHGAPTPLALSLDTDARKLFDEQRQETMRRARATAGLTAGWHGKNPDRLLRLALVFEHMTWAARGGVEPARVAADAVARAGGYIDYATAMFERVITGLAVTRAQKPPHSRLKPLNERSLYQQRGFAWARDAERRGEAFAVLRDAGWLRPPQGDGHRRPRGDWQVNPRVLEAMQ